MPWILWLITVTSRPWYCWHELPGMIVRFFLSSLTQHSLRCQRMLHISWTILSTQSIFSKSTLLVQVYEFLITHCSEYNKQFFSCQTCFGTPYLVFLLFALQSTTKECNCGFMWSKQESWKGTLKGRKEHSALWSTAEQRACLSPTFSGAGMKSSCTGGYTWIHNIMLIQLSTKKFSFSSRYQFGEFTSSVKFTSWHCKAESLSVITSYGLNFIYNLATCAWKL